MQKGTQMSQATKDKIAKTKQKQQKIKEKIIETLPEGVDKRKVKIKEVDKPVTSNLFLVPFVTDLTLQEWINKLIEVNQMTDEQVVKLNGLIGQYQINTIKDVRLLNLVWQYIIK